MIGYFGKAIRQLVLILPKTSGYVKTFKDKNNSKKNKLIYFCIDDNKLLEKYKNTRTKIENHEILNWMFNHFMMIDIKKPKQDIFVIKLIHI